MKKEIFICAAVLSAGVVGIGIFASLFIRQVNAEAKVAHESEMSRRRAIPAEWTSARVTGDAMRREGVSTAPYVLVEFGDYQCPPCHSIAPQLKQIESDSHGRLSIVFRHLPLNSHPLALNAATAAEAAAEQGRFWEMHERLYSDLDKLNEVDIVRYAREIGLDEAKFDKARRGSARQTVLADNATAQSLALRGTPSLLLCDSTGTVSETSLDELRTVFGGKH